MNNEQNEIIDPMTLINELDDLNFEHIQEIEAVEDLAPDMIEEIDVHEITAADEQVIENATQVGVMREEVYAEAPVSEMAEPAIAALNGTKKERKAREPGIVKQPKIERDLSSLPDAVFALKIGEGINKAAVLAKRPTQKKVIEKFENLFISMHAGRKPSVYTMACFETLRAAPVAGVVLADFVAALQGRGYSQGTARSQAGQIANLFNSLGVTDKIAGRYTLSTDSAIADRLTTLASLAA